MRAALLLAAAAALAGCVNRPPPLYVWNGYDDALFHHAKQPQDREGHVERLKTVVQASEQQGLRPPPGVCAEYGYALLEEGRNDDAVAWFGKERDLWPESKLFMEKMIRNAQRGAAGPAPAAQGPAGAAAGRKP